MKGVLVPKILDRETRVSGKLSGRPFVAYKIATTKGSSDVSVEVWRRFRDFEWLRNCLKAEFPTLPIALLPDKRVLGKWDPEHQDQRFADLKVFLKAIMNHPTLATCKTVKKFLTIADQDEWESVKEAFSQQSKSSSKSSTTALESLLGMRELYMNKELRQEAKLHKRNFRSLRDQSANLEAGCIRLSSVLQSMHAHHGEAINYSAGIGNQSVVLCSKEDSKSAAVGTRTMLRYAEHINGMTEECTSKSRNQMRGSATQCKAMAQWITKRAVADKDSTTHNSHPSPKRTETAQNAKDVRYWKTKEGLNAAFDSVHEEYRRFQAVLHKEIASNLRSFVSGQAKYEKRCAEFWSNLVESMVGDEIPEDAFGYSFLAPQNLHEHYDSITLSVKKHRRRRSQDGFGEQHSASAHDLQSDLPASTDVGSTDVTRSDPAPEAGPPLQTYADRDSNSVNSASKESRKSRHRVHDDSASLPSTLQQASIEHTQPASNANDSHDDTSKPQSKRFWGLFRGSNGSKEQEPDMATPTRSSSDQGRSSRSKHSRQESHSHGKDTPTSGRHSATRRSEGQRHVDDATSSVDPGSSGRDQGKRSSDKSHRRHRSQSHSKEKESEAAEPLSKKDKALRKQQEKEEQLRQEEVARKAQEMEAHQKAQEEYERQLEEWKVQKAAYDKAQKEREQWEAHERLKAERAREEQERLKAEELQRQKMEEERQRQAAAAEAEAARAREAEEAQRRRLAKERKEKAKAERQQREEAALKQEAEQIEREWRLKQQKDAERQHRQEKSSDQHQNAAAAAGVRAHASGSGSIDDMYEKKRIERQRELDACFDSETVQRQIINMRKEEEIMARQRARLQAMREKEEAEEMERAAGQAAKEDVERRVKAWAGKYAGFGLRRMLEHLPELFPEVPPCERLGTSVPPATVRKIYLKSLRFVHPDKLTSATPEHKLLVRLAKDSWHLLLIQMLPCMAMCVPVLFDTLGVRFQAKKAKLRLGVVFLWTFSQAASVFNILKDAFDRFRAREL